MTFSHVRASGKPIYGQLKIIKLENQIFIQNCLYLCMMHLQATLQIVSQIILPSREIYIILEQEALLTTQFM